MDEDELRYVVHFIVTDNLAASDRRWDEGVRDKMTSFFFISLEVFSAFAARIDQDIALRWNLVDNFATVFLRLSGQPTLLFHLGI